MESLAAFVEHPGAEGHEMDKTELFNRIRRDGSDLIDEFLPAGAQAQLEFVIEDGRQQVDADAFLMFVSVRAALRKRGMSEHASDCEAACMMAQLNSLS